jgi:Histidine kinase-, DNA gyrase B-, and HSP90-like ATPase
VLNCNILDTGENQDTAYGESSVPNHFIPFYTIPSSPASSGQNLNQSAAAGMLQRALIDVDKRRIAHVLRNLMSNALNFTPTGGEVTVSVRLSSRMGPKFTASSRPYLQSLKGGFSRNATESVTSSSTAPKVFDSRNSVGRDIEPLANQTDQLSFSEGCPSLPPESQHNNVLEPFNDRPPITQHTGFFSNSPWSPHTATPTDNMGSSGLASGRERSNTAGMNPLSGTATPAAMTTDDTHDAAKATSCASWISKKIWNRRRGGNEYGRARKKSLCYMIVEVTDTGIGIARENLDRMFKEIVQFNPNELHGGGHGSNGLGMALSKGIVEAHGGKLWLTSAGLGKGCTFGFGLPLSKSQTIPDLLRKIEKEPIPPCDTSLPEVGEGGHRPRALSLDGAIGEAKEFHCSVIAALSELSGTRGGSGESEGGPDMVPRRNSFEAHLSRAESSRDLGSAIVVAKDRFLLEKAFGSYVDEAETKSHSEMEEDSTISVPGSSAEPAALQSSINTDFIPEVTNHPSSGTPSLSDTISAPIAAADPVLSVKDPPPEVRKELRSGGSPSRASTSSPRTPKHALIVEVPASCPVMSCPLMSCPVLSCYIIPYLTTSHRSISYRTVPRCTGAGYIIHPAQLLCLTNLHPTHHPASTLGLCCVSKDVGEGITIAFYNLRRGRGRPPGHTESAAIAQSPQGSWRGNKHIGEIQQQEF